MSPRIIFRKLTMVLFCCRTNYSRQNDFMEAQDIPYMHVVF